VDSATDRREREEGGREGEREREKDREKETKATGDYSGQVPNSISDTGQDTNELVILRVKQSGGGVVNMNMEMWQIE
jgi:hypothetical protein